MLNFDIYREPFHLMMPDGKSKYRTLLGSLLSIFTLISMLLFAVYKLVDFITLQDYKVQVL